MSRPSLPRAYLGVPFILAALAGCQDPTDPRTGMQPRSVQGNLTTLTVNSLADPGVGVCDETECTLREAIAAAASGDNIVFASGLQGDITLANGDQLSIVGKILTIDGDGRIALDAQFGSRVLEIAGGPAFTGVTLAGLTIKNGWAAVSPTLDGGGIRVVNADLTLDQVTMVNNLADVGGGGIFVDIDAEVTIRNSTIIGNVAGEGAGIKTASSSSLTLVNSTVAGNQAARFGGGVFLSAGELTIQSTTISGNSADIGGGVVNGSTSGSPAGGILTIRSSTITANTAETGPGVVHGGSGARTTLAGTIVAGHQEGSVGKSDCGASSAGFSSLGHNLGEGSCEPFFTAAGDVIVQRPQVFTEVLESELADNGGPTKTHALIARGRAADAGYCPGETTDQRGFARPVDDPAMPNALDACDIGAYELQGPVAVVADLMISQAVNKTSVKQGELLTYFIRVQNLGPEAAPNVVVTNLLSSGVTFVEARHNKGTHTAPPRGETGTVTWSLGDLLDQANEVAEITVTVLVKGRTTITNTASVTGDVADPNEANNSAAIRVSVASGTGGKGGGKK
jgi:uncharacterized repeat protein (TIGR01451 family)/CSLREA domain-containing protein